MKTLKLRITMTPAASEAMDGAQPDDPRRVRLCFARINLATTNLNFVRAVPLPTRGLERVGSAAFVTDDKGNRVTEDSKLRTILGIPCVLDVIRDFELREAHALLAWSGAGNSAMNDFCIAWQDGELAHREQEVAFLEGGYRYPSLVLTPDNMARLQDVAFKRSASGKWEPSVSAKLVVSGQLLVRGGRVIDSYGDSERRRAYCDKRHLIRFPYCRLTNSDGTAALNKESKPNELRTPMQRDFGLDQLINDERLLDAAIAGRVVQLSLNVCDVDGHPYLVRPDDLKKALDDKGYVATNSRLELIDGKRGYYYVDENRAFIVFAPTPYPQHILALCADEPGCVYEIVIGGWSNNSGVTIKSLSEDLVSNGFSDALLMDNGGDAVFVEGANGPNSSRALVPSSLRRNQWAGILTYSSRANLPAETEYGHVEHDNLSNELKVEITNKIVAGSATQTSGGVVAADVSRR